MVWVCLFEVCCIKILGIYVVILHSCPVPLFGAQSAVTEIQYSTSCSTHQWCLCPHIYREIGSIAATSVQMRTENRLETKQHMFKIETMLDICVVINCSIHLVLQSRAYILWEILRVLSGLTVRSDTTTERSVTSSRHICRARNQASYK